MSNELLRMDVGTRQRGVVIIAGSFAPNGSSAVSSASVLGKGFTVARSNTGVFTITLTSKYARCLSATASLALSTPGDQVLQWGAIDVASAKTLVLNVWDISGAAVADISANAANRIHFCLVLQNSTVQ